MPCNAYLETRHLLQEDELFQSTASSSRVNTKWVGLHLTPFAPQKMKRRRSRDVKYNKLEGSSRESDEDSDGDEEEERGSHANKPPWRSIALASFLSLVGVVLLVTGSLRAAGVLDDDEVKATPMLIIGSICFVPGFYMVCIAYYAWKGNYGYSYHDIPS